jgi:hypothetical protein
MYGLVSACVFLRQIILLGSASMEKKAPSMVCKSQVLSLEERVGMVMIVRGKEGEKKGQDKLGVHCAAVNGARDSARNK